MKKRFMRDKNGELIYEGDLVEYFISGEARDSGLFIVVAIKRSNKGIETLTQLDERDKAPYAKLKRVDDGMVLTSPFFSYELYKPEIEDLI